MPLLKVIALLFLFGVFVAVDSHASDRAGECVVLLHGLYRSGISMKPMEWRLQDESYLTANITYPSLTEPIEILAETAVEEGIRSCRDSGAKRIHFVTHSLGGILVRQYLHRYHVPELGRVVMLGPPIQGSELAANLAENYFLAVFLPEAGKQLAAGLNSLPMNLGPVGYEVGIIAGSSNNRPWTPGAPDKPSDGTVAIEETRVEGMTDFMTVDSNHTFMMWHGQVMDETLHFLAKGRFSHSGKHPVPAALPEDP